MPGMQFFGTEPDRKSKLAEAMGGAIEGFVGEKEKLRERKMEFEKIDYDKRKEAYDMAINAGEMVGGERATQMFSNPQFQELENSLGVPHIIDLEAEGKQEPVTFQGKPTWAQKESVQGVEADIRRKIGITTSGLMGRMLTTKLKTRKDALNYISLKKLDPSRFKKILDEVYGSVGGGNGKYMKMSELELYRSAITGNKAAIAEAARRGYKLGR
ncbi:hypothetical protein LCGC14_0686860 [marine sediment metagenome]|uniref:Uncharacterized protein n=1 Tax=marine sediment metagenome TaxID=412755 RepID=A0A0F9T7V1_9ZZZZ